MVNRRLPPLRSLEAFMHTVRLGSARAAANQLGLSPSALSRRIATLEEFIGKKLFTRARQAMQLTDEGAAFHEAVLPHFEALARAVEGQSESTSLLRLHLGVLPLFGTQRLFPRLAELRRLHPILHIDIDTGPHLEDRVGDTLDAAIILSNRPSAGLHAVRLDENKVHAITNAELAETVDTSDEWIVERTGIRARHIAGEGETTATLATDAARAALEVAGLAAQDIDLIILATATPDQTFPAAATKVQAALGIDDCVAFDVAAVCSGFLYAVTVADSMIRSGAANRALVIGSETFSRILDWEDRTTCVLFGDGAGAIVLGAEESGATDPATARGILASKLHADGRHNQLLYVDGGPSTTQTVGKLRMKGQEVFRHAVVNLAAVLTEVMGIAGLSATDIDWLVPHQANARILDATARKLKLPAERVIMTVDRHANTSAASVPLALDTAVKDGRIKQGDLVMFEAMGGGFTWGASLARM